MGLGFGRCEDKLLRDSGYLFDCLYFLRELNAKSLGVRMRLEVLEVWKSPWGEREG